MKLRMLREKKGLTQQNVADGIDCSVNVYSRYERGEREPSIDTILKLASFFDVTTDYLLDANSDSSISLTVYEQEMLSVYRNADKRAKADALGILKSHQIDNP